MVVEIIIEALIGLALIYISIGLLFSGKGLKIGLGAIVMAAGLFLTLDTGQMLVGIMDGVPAAMPLKETIAPYFPLVIGASFIAWLSYVAWAFFIRIGVMGTLWGAFSGRNEAKGDYIQTARNNALADQFLWMVFSGAISAVALAIIFVSWVNQALFQSQVVMMVVAMVWVFVVPPLAIRTSLKSPKEIEALSRMSSLKSVKSERVKDYRELIAVMDEIRDETLRSKLDGLIIDGLTDALTKGEEDGK